MSEVVKDRAKHPFRHHLSLAIHWRSTAPGQAEPYPPEQWGHIKSLHDTLLLRVMIDQVINVSPGHYFRQQKDTGFPQHQVYTQHVHDADTSALPSSLATPLERAPQDAEMYSTCQAVVSSLTRATMRDRAFLSWLTGYSAFSAALLLLYLAAKARKTASTSPALPTSGVQFASNLNQSPADSAWHPGAYEDDPLQGAVAVMAVVGRQFSRVARYKAFVIKLHGMISSQTWIENAGQFELAEDIDRSGPDHLNCLIRMTLAMLERPGQSANGLRA